MLRIAIVDDEPSVVDEIRQIVKATPHRAGGAGCLRSNKFDPSDCIEMAPPGWRTFASKLRSFAFAKHAPGKEFLCRMTEKLQADALPSCQPGSGRQAGFVRCCLNKQ